MGHVQHAVVDCVFFDTVSNNQSFYNVVGVINLAVRRSDSNLICFEFPLFRRNILFVETIARF